MDVLKGVYSKLKNNSNLATDAVPSSRLNENKDKDNHGPPPVPPRRKKNKSKTTTESNGSSESPQTSSTGPNQAIGSVINIVNSNGVHWGPEITYNFSMTTNNDETSVKEEIIEENIKKTTDIIDLMESKEEITHDHLNLISEQLGTGWRSFLRNIGYKEGMIELNYESHHHKGIPEVIYQILLDWTRIEERTLGELVTALWKEGKFSVVRQLCDLVNSKEENLSNTT